MTSKQLPCKNVLFSLNLCFTLKSFHWLQFLSRKKQLQGSLWIFTVHLADIQHTTSMTYEQSICSQIIEYTWDSAVNQITVEMRNIRTTVLINWTYMKAKFYHDSLLTSYTWIILISAVWYRDCLSLLSPSLLASLISLTLRHLTGLIGHNGNSGKVKKKG